MPGQNFLNDYYANPARIAPRTREKDRVSPSFSSSSSWIGRCFAMFVYFR